MDAGSKRVFHRVGDEAWDHPADRPIKRYTETERPCPVCERKVRPHRLDATARRLIEQGAPASEFEEFRKQGWVEWSSRRGRKA
jgi:hypothetical protein